MQVFTAIALDVMQRQQQEQSRQAEESMPMNLTSSIDASAAKRKQGNSCC